MARCAACGADSSDAEFCSDCGAALAPAAVAAPADAPERCPVCGETRGGFARYCDTCRYDFLTKTPFSAAPPPAPPPSAPPPAAPEPVAVSGPIQRWDLAALVDLTLRRPDDPMPADTRERLFPLDVADHLIGRRSDREDIHPEIPLADPGVSRRHARVMRAADGALSVVDLGSMNGTRLNGAALEPNVPAPLGAGDELTLGCWTRLKVRPR